MKGIVTQEYLQKQDGSTDLNVKSKTKYEMDCYKRNDICAESSVFILPTPFKEGPEMELWCRKEVPLHSGNEEGTPPHLTTAHALFARGLEEKSAVLDDISISFSFLTTYSIKFFFIFDIYM